MIFTDSFEVLQIRSCLVIYYADRHETIRNTGICNGWSRFAICHVLVINSFRSSPWLSSQSYHKCLFLALHILLFSIFSRVFLIFNSFNDFLPADDSSNHNKLYNIFADRPKIGYIVIGHTIRNTEPSVSSLELDSL